MNSVTSVHQVAATVLKGVKRRRNWSVVWIRVVLLSMCNEVSQDIAGWMTQGRVVYRLTQQTCKRVEL